MASPPDRPPLLRLDGISKIFGSTQVLFEVDLEVHGGEVVALLGENGAGKSTLSGIIAGSLAPTHGRMEWLGHSYTPASPKQAIDTGIGLIHQELRLLPHLSIAENVFVGQWPTRAGRVDRREMNRRAALQLERLGLNLPPTRRVHGLSTAAQQRIEIAKALALDARLLILDEPTASLGGEESELLFQQVDKLRGEGVGIIYISHRLEEIRRISDRIVVLRDGRKVNEFDRGNIPVRTIVESMVGRKLERMFPDLPQPLDGKSVLRVEGLTSRRDDFRDIHFEVHAGEILGVAGLVGAGRTELVRALSGADPIGEGHVFFHGKDATPKSPRDAIREGLVLVPEDRKLQGLVLEHTLAENISYPNLGSISRRGWILRKRQRHFVDAALRQFNVKGTGPLRANQLSGGNQQKVVLAKWLARRPRVVVLDEPTRGIDVGARSSIYEIIVQLASEGVAVVVVSSDLEEVLGLSHRVLVLAKGRQTGLLDRSEATEVTVMERATA